MVRRGSGLWGISPAAVKSCRQDGARVCLTLEAGVVCADAVIGVVTLAQPRPVGAVLERYWPEPCLGLTTFAERPVVIVDPGAPPTALSQPKGDTPNE